ncbi:MAG: hypothetical protein ACO3A4_08600 [Silvanigrellaceae bacterium]
MTRFNYVSLAFALSWFLGSSSVAHSAAQTSTTVLKLKKPGFLESEVVLHECPGVKDSALSRQGRWAGTMVVLHGSGGAAGIAGLAEMMSQSACNHRLRLAVPAAPTRNRNWPFESAIGERQDEYLLGLIKKDIPSAWKNSLASDSPMLVIVGISAGATFLMGDFYPRHAHKLKGRALALCGGAWPSQDKIVGYKRLDAEFPLFVQIGKSDFLFEQVRAGLTKYAHMGLPLQASFTEAPGHCAFDFNAAVDAVMKVSSK